MATSSGQRIRHRPAASSEVRGCGFKDLLLTTQQERIQADQIFRALSLARSLPPDEFRHQQRSWLEENLPLLGSWINTLYASTIAVEGPQRADPALQGAHLGAKILEVAIEDGVIDLTEAASNVQSWELHTRLGFSSNDATEAEINAMFAPDVVAALLEIQHPAARTLTVITFSLGYVANPQSI